ncbi:hybrid sensor histidine kinase/response regulator [Paraburkholderia phenazinium]|uniref:histidine kinase n=1 Tax=Paraburkholderia phenazinium TaxID=60549 RepID=A0A1N6KXH1_9BURK|nr:PAS domain S-box protein [Paraburkholderia phenazinium]SIO61203.1 PAS domain S-box-containing protein [Paraburkholderia phenazinium]
MPHERHSNNTIQHWTDKWVASVSDYSIFAISAEGRILSWNSGARTIHGYEADEIVGQPLDLLYTAGDRQRGVPAAGLEIARRKGRHDTEGWRIRKDGTTFWASVVINALHADDGQLAGFVKIVRDMTDKKAAHDAVLESERRFRIMVHGVTDYAIFMLSPEGLVTNWNSGARRIKGYTADEIIGSHFSRFYLPEDAAAGLPQRGLDAAAKDGRFEAEGWRVRKDGTRFWAHVVIDAIREDDGTLAGFAKITRDITERMESNRLLEDARKALFQSQKMEAIGKLTGGVAHDFNNVLQVLRGNLELLDKRHAGDVWTRERLDKALDAVERGAKLASQLLAFGRQQPLQPVVINLAPAIRGMDDLLRRALGETIEMETVVAGGLWNTLVDIHQLENVILNLAINARDAMPDGGKLTMELANAMLDDQYVTGVPDVPAGQYVMLAVTDTGTGMPPEVVEQAFEPFFTTKAEGQGTGLGLSTAYGFVRQSGGHARIYSEVGYGTTIRIYLPRSTETAVEPPPRPSVKLQGGTETILVVEDDLKVQSTVVDTLSGLGYRVLKADSTEEALTVIRSGVHLDLLFTDVVMPGLPRSPEMVAQAVRLLPGLKVLFTSGYTQNAIVHGGRLDPGVELLSKPYSREQLAAKIRQMLRATGATEPDRPATLAAAHAGTPGLRVLLVDDDVALLEATSELIRMLGHEPVITGSPDEALRWLGERTFDVLLADLAIPGKSGIELAAKAVQLRPALRVIFASGNEMPDAPALTFNWKALRKPYTLDQLSKVLDSSRP